jgi:hypothetical protein
VSAEKNRLIWTMVSLFIVTGLVAAAEVELSERCGRCHETIYKTWKSSLHAESLRNDNFLHAFRDTQEAEGQELASLCLRCHAPIREVIADDDLIYHLTWEGVNCDICHSLSAVKKTKSGFDPVFDLENGKFGPFEDSSDDAHEIQYSPLHSSSELCAWCHEYTNSAGTPVLATWSEWKKSKAAASGQTCQSCHMGEVSGDAVDPRLDRDPAASINLHSARGGHSLDQLHKALSISLQPERIGAGIEVAVLVRNKGAGHAVPTGMPGRRVILELELRVVGGEVFKKIRVYGKQFETEDGREIRLDREYFKPGIKLKSDTTLQSDELRTERFRFPVPEKSTAILKVRMFYEHTLSGGDQTVDRINFFSEKRTLRPKRSR